MFMRDSSKLFGVLKNLTLGTYSKTWIKGLKCDRKVTQELQIAMMKPQKVHKVNKLLEMT